jgi:hypothetical protein
MKGRARGKSTSGWFCFLQLALLDFLRLTLQPHMSTPAKILYCRCAYAQVLPNGVKDAVLEGLCASGATFETVADLCEMAAHRDERLKAFASAAPLKIAACYPRVVRGLFTQCGATLPTADADILNMRTLTAEDVVAALLTPTSPQP